MKKVLSLTIALAALAALPLQAQDSHNSNSKRPVLYPDHLSLQFAGNIGLLSAGIGYSYAKDRLQTDVLYGFVPAFESHTTIHILTVKTAYRSRTKPLNNRYGWVPVRAGTGISYSVGRQFFTQLPDRYPNGYYWLSTSFRLTPFVGTAVNWQVNESKNWVKKMELYTELGTTDIHLLSYAWNTKALKPWQLFNLAFGLKTVF